MNRFVENRFEEAAAFGLRSSKLRFQPAAQSHEFIDFGNDAVLFGEDLSYGLRRFFSQPG